VRFVQGLRPPAVEWAAISALATLVVAFAVALLIVGSDALIEALRKFDSVTLGICLVLMAWQLGCRFLRWLMFTRALGLKIEPAEAALYYAAAFGMTLTPGRLGEALRLWFLKRRFAVPYRRIGGLYVADRVADAAAYLVLLAVGTAGYKHHSPIAWSALVVVVAVIIAIMNPRPVIAVLTAVYAVLGRGRKLTAWARRAVRNASILFQPRVFLPGLAIGAVGWLAAPAVLTMSLARLGVDFAFLPATAIYAAAALAGGSTMMPGGGGATEAVLVVLLRASDVPLDAAVTAMIMTRLMFLWLPVLLGVALLPAAVKSVRHAGPA